MPELPEVETQVRDLAVTRGWRITEVVTDTPQAWRSSSEAARALLVGREVTAVVRRAKFLIFTLAGDVSMVAHLRMTGHFLWREVTDPPDRWPRHIFTLTRGEERRELRLEDSRRFATLAVMPTADLATFPSLARLGPEPLSDDFTPTVLASRLRGRRPLKAALLDQTVVAGLGNIYVDEACHRAGLHPLRATGSLSIDEVHRLHAAIRTSLRAGIRRRGTTLARGGQYRDASGARGTHATRLLAYGRAGEACLTCGTTLQKITIAQRTTTFCARCQPLI